jgi:hypothetical protein
MGSDRFLARPQTIVLARSVQRGSNTGSQACILPSGSEAVTPVLGAFRAIVRANVQLEQVLPDNVI